MNSSDFPALPKDSIKRAEQAASQAVVQEFQKNGAICIKQLLNQSEIDLLKAGIDANLENLSPRAKVASRANDPGLFVEDFCNWQNFDQYRDFLFTTPLAPLAALLMQSHTARFYHDHLLVKEANTQQRTPWHQDQPYYNIEGRQNCSFWIAVDAVPREHSLEFIAASHLGPWLMPRSFMDNQAKWFADGTLTELPKIEDNRCQFQIISWPVEPGDVICFHMLTLHGASGVQNNRRRVFSARFIGDDIVHAPRPWVTSPQFEGLAGALPAGAPLEHPLFPLIWSAADQIKAKTSGG